MDPAQEAILVRSAFTSPESRSELKDMLRPLVEAKAVEYRSAWNALAVTHDEFVRAGLNEFDPAFDLYLKNVNDPAVTSFSIYYAWRMSQAMYKLIDTSIVNSPRRVG